MPAPEAVAGKELALADPRKDVLEVRSRGGERSDRDRARRAVPDQEREGADEAASDLELARPDVLVRDHVPERMQDRPERESSRP